MVSNPGSQLDDRAIIDKGGVRGQRSPPFAAVPCSDVHERSSERITDDNPAGSQQGQMIRQLHCRGWDFQAERDLEASGPAVLHCKSGSSMCWLNIWYLDLNALLQGVNMWQAFLGICKLICM